MDKKSLIAIASFAAAVIFLLAVCFWAQKSELAPDPVLVKMPRKSLKPADLGDLPGGALLFENMAVYDEVRGEINYLILKKDGQETIIDQGKAEFERGTPFFFQKDVRHFNYEAFSPRGGYLVYDAWSYEDGQSYVFDIAQKKIVYHNPWPVKVEFTEDEANYFACGSEPLRGWREARVISAGSGMAVFDAMVPPEVKFPKVECAYDRDEESVTFNVTETKVFPKEARHWKTKYFLKTGQQETVSAKPEY